MSRRQFRFLGVGLVVLALCFSGGCNDSGDDGVNLDSIGDNDPNVILVMGDSISLGTAGIVPYPPRLGALSGKAVVNSSHSGETAPGGAGRIQGQLAQHKPAVVIIFYGANDAIQGRDPVAAGNAVRAMVSAAKANQTVPLVATVLPLYGSRSIYQGNVDAVNAEIIQAAKDSGAKLVNTAKDFKGREDLYVDGLHPNDTGQGILAVSFYEKL